MKQDTSQPTLSKNKTECTNGYPNTAILITDRARWWEQGFRGTFNFEHYAKVLDAKKHEETTH